jgi:quinohemoprotein ethanol dehydrogenase
MTRLSRPAIGLVIASALILGVTGAALGHTSGKQAAKVTIPVFQTSDLTATPADNWISQSGNLFGQRNSSLSQVTPSNISGLKQAWHVVLKTSTAEPLLQLNGEAPQLEYNGTLFAEDQYGRVYARNATTGAQTWVYEPHSTKLIIPAKNQGVFKIAGPWASTRGLAINDGTVYAEEQTGKVVALNSDTGQQVWATQIAPASHGIGLSQPPTYYNGMILGATSGGDTGFPCIVFALDAKSGKMLWKFDLIPSKKTEFGYSTWAHPLAFDGGGAVWTAMTVDPSNGLVYASVGNPIPYAGLLRGPGKEYFTDGVVALHADTGKYAWFFQEVHHDIWDADQSQQTIAFDMTYNGQARHALVSANKDGLVYVLDRDTGQPIIPVTEMKVQQSKEAHTYPTQPIPSTDPLVPQNVPNRAKWKGLTAADGKPYNIGPGGPAGSFVAIDSKRYSVTAAFGQGASGNKPASVDPTNHYLIEETTPGFSAFEAVPNSEVSKLSYLNFGAVLDLKIGVLKGTPAATSGTRLEAMDLTTGKLVWTVDRTNPTSAKAAKTSEAFGGGVLTTPGIVWTNGGKHLQAFSETTGKLIWSSPELKGTSFSPPTVYAVNGKQYVTTFLGGSGDLYAFALP